MCSSDLRVMINKNIEVRSVNGPDVTIVEGQYDPQTGTYGSNAVRCAYLDAGALLIGFTLTRGAAVMAPYDVHAICGGGLLLNSGAVSNCVIRDCRTWYGGGGVLLNAFDAVMDGCVVVRNTSGGIGGGVMWNDSGALMRNCLMADNVAGTSGGGAHLPIGILEHCTVAGNQATSGGGFDTGEGSPTLVNTIVRWNSAPTWPEYPSTASNVIWSHCNSEPQPPGTGNQSADPGFWGGGDYHLRANSPCVDAGTNLDWTAGATDWEGEPRLRGARVDIGADEAFDFACIAVSNVNGVLHTTWDTVVDAPFRPRATTNLPAGSWTDLPLVTSVNSRVTVRDPQAAGTVRSYRLHYAGN